jgi:hypothetical protein
VAVSNRRGLNELYRGGLTTKTLASNYNFRRINAAAGYPSVSGARAGETFMKKTTAVIAALFASGSIGISTIAAAAAAAPDSDPMAVNPLDTTAMPQLPQAQISQPTQPQQWQTAATQWQLQAQQMQQMAPQQWQPAAVQLQGQMQVPQPAYGQPLPATPYNAQQPAMATQPMPQQQQQVSGVIVNDVPLTMDTVAALRASGLNVVDGNYWYDRTSGFYGYKGGPAAGMISPGLNLGGPLKPDCSNGTSGFFVNGRQLTIPEAAALVRTLHAPQARYTLDADMNFGFEGRPPAMNLRQLMAQQQEPQQHKSLSERGMLYTPPVVVPGVGASGDGFSYSHE